jgi:predicted transcriptional regulator
VLKFHHKENEMTKKLQMILASHDLSKRERQVMSVIYKRKRASVKGVLEEIPNPPTYSAVRSVLRVLRQKGFVKYKKLGKKFIYSPAIPRTKAVHSAVNHLMTTYFDNSVENAVTTIIKIHRGDLTDEDLHRLTRIIENTRKDGKE